MDNVQQMRKNPPKKLLTAFICFFITTVLSALIFATLQIYPGGKYTLLTYDLAMHDLPYIASLRYLGHGDSSFWYSMMGGLGGSYVASYAYYIACPLNLLTVFVPLEYMPHAIYILTLLKLGCCSFTFCLYILYGIRHSSHRYMIILISVSYGLSSYNMFYSLNLMWLDALVLLPLILIGVEELIHGKVGAVYVFSLTASLYVDYYITYMSGIFVCLYLIYRLTILNIGIDKCKRTVSYFVLLSFVSLGLSMPLLLPALKYMAIGATSDIPPIAHIIRVTPLRVIRNMFPFGEFYILNEGPPQLFCATLTLILIIIFFLSAQVSVKEKISTLGVFLVYFISFLLAPLDRIWHGFREPTCMPARYAFTCVCFMLIIACRALETDTFSSFEEKITGRVKMIRPLIFTIVLAELFINGSTAIMELNNNSSYKSYDKYISEITHFSSALENLDDDGLYRIASVRYLTSADGFLFGYNDISYFSSAYDAALHDFLNRMGFFNRRHNVTDQGITPVTAGILGVKYVMGCESDYYDVIPVTGSEPYALFSNPHALPIGYLVDAQPVGYPDSDNPFSNQESVISSMLGKKVGLFEPIPYQLTENSEQNYSRSTLIEAVVANDGPIYMYHPLAGKPAGDPASDTEYRCVVNDSDVFDFMKVEHPFCIYIGKYKKGDHLTVRSYSTTYYGNPYMVTMNPDTYRQVMGELAQHPFGVTSHNNAVIEGKITGIPGKKLAISLPYLEGYKVFTDGKRSEYEYYNPAMISVNIPKGEHIVRIEYTSPGRKAGTVIGISSLLLFIMWIVICKRRTVSQA